MSNPLLNKLTNTVLGSNGVSSASANGGGNGNILQQFLEFKRNFKGDPQKKINELLSSGKVTQAQLDEATNTAKMLKGMIGK